MKPSLIGGISFTSLKLGGGPCPDFLKDLMSNRKKLDESGPPFNNGILEKLILLRQKQQIAGYFCAFPLPLNIRKIWIKFESLALKLSLSAGGNGLFTMAGKVKPCSWGNVRN